MKTPPQNIYDPIFVEDLFSRMSATYDRMNTITSFGFSTRWRRQCAATLQLRPGMKVVDLMTGMGEAWPFVLPEIGTTGRLMALDFCVAMTLFAEQRRKNFPGFAIEILSEDALESSIPDSYADAVISTFGLKTFNQVQLEKLAMEVDRILKPGGTFAMVEVSKPASFWLQKIYLFYLKQIIPILGKIFLGDPESYRMLGVYTTAFGNCQNAKVIFEKQGFEVKYLRFFGGCASGLQGRKSHK